jgi:hypothetical protein
MISESKFAEVFGKGQKMTKEYLNSADGLVRRRKVQEFLRTVEGMQSYSKLCEAMGTSDFSYLLTADMNAQLLAMQQAVPVTYPMWTRQVRVNDFKSTPLPALEGPIRRLQERGENEGLGKTYLGESQYTIQAKNYADSLELTRQAIINDALGCFNSVPEIFSRAAADTAEYLATSKIALAAGPDTTLFPTNDSHGNYTTSELSIASVIAAANKMAIQTDDKGNQLNIMPKGIMVPPALRMKAIEVVTALTVERYDLSSEVGYKTTGNNPLAGLEVAVNAQIPVVSSSNTYKNKQWYLYGDPVQNRPTVAFAVLNSNPTPRIFRKAPDAQVLGGAMDQYSYEMSTIGYKVEWDIGAAQIDYRCMVANKPTS